MSEMHQRCGIPLAEATDPHVLFDCWMKDAKASELNDPNAMSLATATPGGVPSVRIVLLKRFDASGFAFYTNGESRKGGELRANPHAALCFHWKSRHRQVRVEGTITELPAADADAYFEHRPRMSQVGAWASQQSRPLASREELESLTKQVGERFPKEVPRPPYWTGFLLTPRTIEFWQEGDFRLHDRILFTCGADGSWGKGRIFP
ncbi:Pyridoxamine 5'-phosphate oxidase [Granulicella rosea]|uniref:Pyridoxamine 5'-phosphate oxidase n=1 Tax=Granulicella rosea TaxID=474952 RepID=A0A239GZU5_9BACT|nr:pyridoxamine 5'-phosphate oxidase [Granulicella rosea]SNS74657.1 Pyridoxamine 5'-phosphate oxidase [Granulicella rosea]